MNRQKIAIKQDIGNFDYGKTKMNVNNFFENLDELKWERAKLNAQRGLATQCDFSLENKKQPYISVEKDEFSLSAIENNSEEMTKHLSDFNWAQSILSEQEQLYITEYFINGKYENEVVGLLGFNSSDSRAFRKLKRKAIYKFAFVLNLLV